MNSIDLAKTGFVIALAAVLAGCGGFNFSVGSLNPWSGPTERARSVPPGATEYACDNGKRLVVRYPAGTNAAMIVFREREFRLDQTTTATGTRYTNGRTILHLSGDQASLEEEGAVTYSGCRKAAG